MRGQANTLHRQPTSAKQTQTNKQANKQTDKQTKRQTETSEQTNAEAQAAQTWHAQATKNNKN